jgi:hypothetical protein
MRATMKACHHAVHIERKTRSLREAMAIRIKLLCRANPCSPQAQGGRILSTVNIKTALPASFPIGSASDVSRLINTSLSKNNHARVVVLPILKARFGTDMFWIVALAAVIPIVLLVLIRYEPTEHDIDDEDAPVPATASRPTCQC